MLQGQKKTITALLADLYEMEKKGADVAELIRVYEDELTDIVRKEVIEMLKGGEQ